MISSFIITSWACPLPGSLRRKVSDNKMEILNFKVINVTHIA